MKKVMFFMAVAGMFAFAACNNNNATEEVIDTLPAEEIVEEPTCDTLVEAAAEEAVEATAEAVAE
ncbi:MAG: hypothetical protein IJK84_05140 [Bacteroidales bacterium]|nr:hypothetical protein [Bacteroidales bacterium]